MTATVTGRLIRLALGIARKLAGARGMAHYEDELGSVALEALGRALAGYDAGVGEVEPYAAVWISREVGGAIQREQERREILLDDAGAPSSVHASARVEELARDVIDVAVSSAVGEELHGGGEAEVLRREAWAVLRVEVGRLEPEDLRLVELRYFDAGEPTWREVGAALGVSERRAKERDAQIRERLRNALVAWDRVRPLRRE